VKYLCVVNRLTEDIQEVFHEIPRRGGFFNWLQVFNGDLFQYDAKLMTKEWLEQYDIVHVNLPPADQLLIPKLRRTLSNNSKTKLVGNNDHVCEIWHKFGNHYDTYHDVQRQCDMVFGTEHHQTSHMIDTAKVIPHPHDIEVLKHMYTDMTYHKVGVLFHHWEGKTFTTSILCDKIFKQFGMTSKVYAYENSKDECQRWGRILFDEFVGGLAYPDFIDDLISNKIVIEPCSYHTYGRTTVDLAAIGIPCVGSNRVDSMRRCFPFTSFDPYDIAGQLKVIKQLLNDEQFKLKVIAYAKNASEYYNYNNSRKRFLDALNEVKE
jgi:hypothetical protein